MADLSESEVPDALRHRRNDGETPPSRPEGPREHQVVLLRHGETQWSMSGRHTGTTDLELIDEGRRQAVRAGALIAGRDFALVLTSPLRRATETSQLAGLRQVPTIDADLAEWDYGAYEGLTSAEIERLHPGWSLWTDGCPDGESGADVAARVDRVIARCRATDGTVALVAHGHVLRVLAARWVGLGPDCGRLFELGTASVSVLGWEHHKPTIHSWNLTNQRL